MQEYEENERGDEKEQKEQVRRADIDLGRIGRDRRELCSGGAGIRGSLGQKCVAVPEERLVRSKSRKDVKPATASGSSFQVEGDANWEFVRDGKKCCMKFWDADVGIRLRDRGRRKQGRVCTVRIVHRKREHGSTDACESETRSVRGQAERSDRIEGERKRVAFQESGGTNDVQTTLHRTCA